ncbi:TetR/AcrR family transcriptional regulator [Saccharopolyspora phatthalungensis]|uniref:AcrR family transcriptional regulator n=1 Tax=Saccharopolyspora phatthalungensis TaxID=664693 RepID=A0A840QFW3_9PSEU|nr:TetR family transcriptional regulator [Saccharopolyspora phatthalungensis]MBB5158971.1 AcrR family transcriptional regulator [Saccharopolyspora phatthalungensis]
MSTPPRSRAAVGLPPVTPDEVVDAAVRLTFRHGLDGWSIRALAAEVGVAQAVVYHHVGDRSQIVQAVARKVLAQIPLPSADLSWRDWFSTLFTDIRKVALQYHGVAREILVFGPVVDSHGIIDAGIETLRRAGFGTEAPMIFNYLSNTAFSLIAAEDERNSAPDKRLERARRLVDIAQESDRPGLATMAEWLRDRSKNMDYLRAHDAHFYRYCMRRALDGAQARLPALRKRAARRRATKG